MSATTTATIIADRTLVDGLSRHARDQPDRTAYRTSTRVVTFGQFERITDQMANALVALGATSGSRVAVLTKHHIDCVLLSIAACKIGAVCMPVNWRLAASEVEYILNDGQALFLMADEAFLPVVRKASLPGVRLTVCTERATDDAPCVADWYGSFADRFEPVHANGDDAALQLYSSGTTGLPKGIVLTHAGLLSTSRTVANDWKFDRGCVLGNALPVFHVAGMTMLLLTLYTGGQSVVFSDFDPAAFIDGIGTYGITHSFIVPAMLLFMLQSPAVKQGRFGSLRQLSYGGSPISERVLIEAIDTFKCDFLQVYGLTEVSGPATFLFPDDHRSGDPQILRSAGRAIGGGRLRVVDPVTLADLPDGQVGEILIECERNLKEYWRNPEATARAFPEGRNANGGWFRSGDGGYLDKGYLYVSDRIKDMVISGGENIYPAEVENVLMRHPAVADGAVIGVPDATWGEAVKACVVLRPGIAATGADIIGFMREHLAHYKCPKSVDIVAELPRNASGKVLKRTLRAPYWEGRERSIG